MKSIAFESVDLVYLDPPFYSDRQYEAAGVDSGEVRSFDDHWANIESYIAYMRQRVEVMHRLLKPTGSIYLHCDWHASHYLKLMMDAVFGVAQFQNEIIWCYEVGARSKKRWARKHDTILFYSKSTVFTFNWKAVRIPRNVSTNMRVGIDSDGRQYQEKTDSKSRKVYRYYLDEGAVTPDFWVGIQQLNRDTLERIGYPTQKPEALLERVLAASSNPDDVVLDPFCGSGTTLAVAQRLKRRWVGIDISKTAIELSRCRLQRQDWLQDTLPFGGAA